MFGRRPDPNREEGRDRELASGEYLPGMRGQRTLQRSAHPLSPLHFPVTLLQGRLCVIAAGPPSAYRRSVVFRDGLFDREQLIERVLP